MTEAQVDQNDSKDFSEAAIAAIDSVDGPTHIINGMSDADRQMLTKEGVRFKTGVVAELDATRVPGAERPAEKKAGKAVLNAMLSPTGGETETIDARIRYLDADRGEAGDAIEAHTDTTPDNTQTGEKPSLDAVLPSDHNL